VVDRFSKLAKFTSTQINTMAARTIKLFFGMWVQHYGMLEVSEWSWCEIQVGILDVVNEGGDETKI
jgi:hypothetical protein